MLCNVVERSPQDWWHVAVGGSKRSSDCVGTPNLDSARTLWSFSARAVTEIRPKAGDWSPLQHCRLAEACGSGFTSSPRSARPYAVEWTTFRSLYSQQAIALEIEPAMLVYTQ
jgi:hypothetical protein